MLKEEAKTISEAHVVSLIGLSTKTGDWYAIDGIELIASWAEDEWSAGMMRRMLSILMMSLLMIMLLFHMKGMARRIHQHFHSLIHNYFHSTFLDVSSNYHQVKHIIIFEPKIWNIKLSKKYYQMKEKVLKICFFFLKHGHRRFVYFAVMSWNNIKDIIFFIFVSLSHFISHRLRLQCIPIHSVELKFQNYQSDRTA